MTRHGLTFWDRVAPADENGCRLWTGPANAQGYGRVRKPDGKHEYAHRVAYAETHGSVPEGLEVDHLCRVRRCCNPEHLEAVTRAENLARVPLRETCAKGHSDYRRAKRGTRYCYPCQQEAARRTTERRRNRPNDPDPALSCPGQTHRA